MAGDVRFEPDLYRGTADYYDRFRLPYPDAMIADLVRRAAPSGRGRLLDLACGTGQLAFPLRDSFAEVWCVDAEPDMTEVVRAKALAVGAAHMRALTVGAEDLPAGPDSFESIVIGNAFHRLRRAAVAALAHTWLRPGGRLALCWSTSPWAGSRDWQRALAGVLRTWQNALGAAGRVPPG
ncbi:class I SAM-dependent methyltransferase [Streptomyces mirabilis]|uniref:class I SAM-dependent methyltransferase n=1 Tax=Streptomyces mirabilis TaxID=68239 RepID=UPI003691A01B